MEKENKEWYKSNLFKLGSLIFMLIAAIVLLFPLLSFWLSKYLGGGIEQSGQLGDTMGGTMGPFIAIIASFLTFIAFYVQYQANEQQKKDLQIERFESKFYELLRLHKENVNELSTSNFFGINETFEYLSTKPINGRQVFFEMNNILSVLLLKSTQKKTINLNTSRFNESYTIFFWGSKAKDDVDDEFYDSLFSFFDGKRFQDYNGVSFYLGHYYRHLFMTVKYVVESPIIKDYDEKMKYLKILRAQLSNHEQIMLFYNWLSGYGGAWENEENHFFTKYKMIHNLWTDELFQDEYIASEVNKLIDIYNLKYKGKKPLFEFQGEDFEYKMELITKEN